MNSSSKVVGIDGYRLDKHPINDSVEVTRLAIKLQQTLELSPLLQTFCEEARRIIPCDSVSFRHPIATFNFQTGKSKPHLCRYHLEVEGEDLGEIECTRTKPFSIKETDMIERLLSLLVYPLRNSLMYQKAVAEAFRDPLTQISNRAAFDEALKRECCSNRRHGGDFSLLVIDIDHFKQVNDNHGHLVGDKVLSVIAQVIKNTIRRSDEVFRYGGEEFVVLLSNTQLEGARFIAERIRKEIKQTKVKQHEDIQLTTSIGLCATDLIEDASELLYHADRALYQAKEQGRDKVVSRP